MKEAGYTSPTPIQASAWPHSFKGRDCLAIAKTGSGKTLGYLMSALIDIHKKGKNHIFFLFKLN